MQKHEGLTNKREQHRLELRKTEISRLLNVKRHKFSTKLEGNVSFNHKKVKTRET